MAGTDNPRTRQAKLIGGRDRKAGHWPRWNRPPGRLFVGLSSRLRAVRTLRTPLLILVLTVLAVPSASNAQLPPLPGKDVAAERKPQLFVPEIATDIGSVIEGDHAPVHWRLENRGNADLIIEKIKSACGCTVVDLADADKIIPPGGTLDLRADFDSSKRSGLVRKQVAVHSNDPFHPVTMLEFTATVSALYNVNKSARLNFGKLKRGWTAKATIDITPATGRGSLEVLDMQLPSDSPLRFVSETLDSEHGPGTRIIFTVNEDAPLDNFSTQFTVAVRVGDIEKTRKFRIRGAIVGDLVYQPRMLDETGHKSRRGKRLAPITIQSINREPFDITSVSVSGPLDATIEQSKKTNDRTLYSVFLTIRDDAPPGPFGALLEARTSLFEQPVIRIPVFAIVENPIEVDPPIILLRQDGTPAGTSRRVKLSISSNETLEVSDATSSNPAVVVQVTPRGSSAAAKHVRYLEVSLAGSLSVGVWDASVTLRTNVAGAELLKIPVTIEVPESAK